MTQFKFAALALVAVASIATARAQVTTINFDDLTFNNYDRVAEGYKSRDTNTTHVVVDFRTLTTGSNTVFDNSVSLWNSGYSTLTKNAFQFANGTDFEMRLIADPGYTVSLLDFQFGAFNSSNISSFLRVTDSLLGVLYSEGSNTVTQPNVPPSARTSPPPTAARSPSATALIGTWA